MSRVLQVRSFHNQPLYGQWSYIESLQGKSGMAFLDTAAWSIYRSEVADDMEEFLIGEYKHDPASMNYIFVDDDAHPRIKPEVINKYLDQNHILFDIILKPELTGSTEQRNKAIEKFLEMHMKRMTRIDAQVKWENEKAAEYRGNLRPYVLEVKASNVQTDINSIHEHFFGTDVTPPSTSLVNSLKNFTPSDKAIFSKNIYDICSSETKIRFPGMQPFRLPYHQLMNPNYEPFLEDTEAPRIGLDPQMVDMLNKDVATSLRTLIKEMILDGPQPDEQTWKVITPFFETVDPDFLKNGKDFGKHPVPSEVFENPRLKFYKK